MFFPVSGRSICTPLSVLGSIKSKTLHRATYEKFDKIADSNCLAVTYVVEIDSRNVFALSRYSESVKALVPLEKLVTVTVLMSVSTLRGSSAAPVSAAGISPNASHVK